MVISRSFLLACIMIAVLPAIGRAAPTPVPGGANGVTAISGRIGDTVFNGVLRIKIVALREADAADHAELAARNSDMAAPGGKKLMIMKSLLRNGTRDEFDSLMQYTLADKDDVSVQFASSAIQNANIHILQGAAGRQTAAVLVDADFVPTKLIVECPTCGAHSGFRPVRFVVAH